jgi:hypothetical protein
VSLTKYIYHIHLFRSGYEAFVGAAEATRVFFKSPKFPDQLRDYNYFISKLTYGVDSTAMEGKMFTYTNMCSKLIELFLLGGKM